MNAAVTPRRALQDRLFPGGIPELWCPPLTHFSAPGVIDAERIRRHLRALAPDVKGLLVPGSTGEGWEMADGEIRALLDLVLEAAVENGQRVLIGVLKTDAAAVLRCLDQLPQALAHPAAVGVTLCPPRGRGLTQAQLRESLRPVLDRGLPVALYQLPQVTQNEMAPGTVAALAAEFPNFYLFKDTSGADRVVQSGVDLGQVFLVRGAETGGYARWPRIAGGPYDGFLLSSANVFARELHRLLGLLRAGRTAEAAELDRRLEATVAEGFALVKAIPQGNPFTNANKLFDHWFAYAAADGGQPAPMLRSGVRMPDALLAAGREVLCRYGFFPAEGYLDRSVAWGGGASIVVG